jgi:hypothetical protein
MSPPSSGTELVLVTAGQRGIRTIAPNGSVLEHVSDRPVSAAVLHGTLVFAVAMDGAIRVHALEEQREHVLVAPSPDLHGPDFDHESCRFEHGEFWLEVSSIAVSGCALAVTMRDDVRDDWVAVQSVSSVNLTSGHTKVDLSFSRLRFEELGLRVPACASSREHPGVKPPPWVECERTRDANTVSCPQPAESRHWFDADACGVVGPEGARPLPTFDDGDCMVELGPCHSSQRWQVLSVAVMPGDYLEEKHLVLDRETGGLHPLSPGAWPPALDDAGLEVFGGERTGFELAGRTPIESLTSGAYAGRLRYLGFDEYFAHGSELVELGVHIVDLGDEILGILERSPDDRVNDERASL